MTNQTAEAQRSRKQYWRRGYSKEARNLIDGFACFELDIEETYAVTWTTNIPGTPVNREDALSVFLNRNIANDMVSIVYINTAM